MEKKLEVGQRIDVYEVVDGYSENLARTTHFVKHGTQVPVNNCGVEFMEPIWNTPKMVGYLFLPNELKKCGYYLKVKSLKKP